jgi:hypothetical protein
MLIADEEDDDMMDVDEPIPSRPGKANPTTSGIPKIKPAPGTPAALFEDVFEDVNAVLYGQVARKAIIKAMIIAFVILSIELCVARLYCDLYAHSVFVIILIEMEVLHSRR